MKHKYSFLWLLLAFSCYLMVNMGCASKNPPRPLSSNSVAGLMEEAPGSGRMIVWTASLTLEVNAIDKVIPAVNAIVEENGGYIENKTITPQKSGRIKIRIPSKQLVPIMDQLAQLGDEKERSISSMDLTDQYIDTEARLSNALALQDRLKQLLDKAKDVQDILAIEKELTRIQSDIDSMEGRLKKLKGQVDFATIGLYLDQKTIFGPLGYVAKGIAWVIKKLFIIR